MPNNGRAGPWHISIPKLQRKHCTDFYSHFINFHCQLLWMSVILASYFHQNCLSFVFLILSILTGIRWNIKVTLFAFVCGLRLLNIILKVPQPFVVFLLGIFYLDIDPIFIGLFSLFPHSIFHLFFFKKLHSRPSSPPSSTLTHTFIPTSSTQRR